MKSQQTERGSFEGRDEAEGGQFVHSCCDFDLFVIYLSKVSELFTCALRELCSLLFELQINSVKKSNKIHISLHRVGDTTLEVIIQMYTERN